MLLNYRVYQKKVYSWKIFSKLKSAQNLRKLSVSLGSLAPSGTSSTKFILKCVFSRVGNVLLEGTLKMACAQKKVFIYAI